MDKVKGLLATISLAYKDAVPAPRIITVLVLLAVLVASAILIWGLGFSKVPGDSDSLHYLLSTQAQVLATILALVLTLSLLAGQLATRYAHRAFTQVFGWWWGPYLVLYIFGTAVPLFLLMGNFWLTGVRLSLLLAILCLALLFPYFVVLKRRLSMEFIIGRLKETAISGYGTKPSYASRENADSAVTILDNITMGAFQGHDLDSFDLAIHAMSSVAEDIAAQQTPNEASGPAYRIINRLNDTGLRVLDDPSAPSLVIAALDELGRSLAHKHSSLSNDVSEALKNLGESAANKGREQVVSSTIHSLRSIGMELLENGAEDVSLNLIYYHLRILCAGASRQKLGDPAFHALGEIGQLGSNACAHGRETSVHEALSELSIMARILLDNDLVASFREVAFAAGQIGKSCITHSANYPNLKSTAADFQVADTLWNWATRSRSRWNDWDVNIAFLQNLEALAVLPSGRPIVDRAYSSRRGVFQNATTEGGLSESELVAVLDQIKHECDYGM
ncbi:MAG: hypothetical protein ABID84_00060 [Chloroflexota bacterium]